MSFFPVMLSVWGAVIVFFLAVRIYAGRVARDEEDQLVLSDSSSHIKAEQDAIAEQIHRLMPLQRASQVLLAAATLFVAGYFILDVLHQFSF